ncbi:Uncharacterised protein [Mycobacteroides abscessus subsp. abscessus]|nr:Uncharacterised protein [Mycobacteroides abscessus subsp. abscessus]
MQRIRRRQEARARPPGGGPRHERRGKQRLPADDERRICGRRRAQELLNARHAAPPRNERDDRGNERGSREDHHGQATQLQAARNPMLHRRGLVVARIARGNEPHRADQRDQHAADRARPPMRVNTRSPRQKPRRQQEARHGKQRGATRITRRRPQQNPHQHDQQSAHQRRDRTIVHVTHDRRAANDGGPQVPAQAERVARRRVIHPRVRAQRQVGDHREHRDQTPAREGRLDSREDTPRPAPRDSHTDRRSIRHVRGRGSPGTGYFSDALAHRPIVSESARGRDAARRPRADLCCDVSAKGSRARSAPSAKECAPRARPRPRAPPPSRQPCRTSPTRSHPRGPSSCPRGP